MFGTVPIVIFFCWRSDRTSTIVRFFRRRGDKSLSYLHRCRCVLEPFKSSEFWFFSDRLKIFPIFIFIVLQILIKNKVTFLKLQFFLFLEIHLRIRFYIKIPFSSKFLRFRLFSTRVFLRIRVNSSRSLSGGSSSGGCLKGDHQIIIQISRFSINSSSFFKICSRI